MVTPATPERSDGGQGGKKMFNIPNWDLFLIIFFVVGIAYGFILQRDKTVITMIAAYVALVIIQVTLTPIQQFFNGDKALFGQFFLHINTTPLTIQLVLFIGIITLVTAKSGLSGKNSDGLMGPLEIFGYSVLNVALIASSIFFFMPEAMRAGFDEGSKIAHYLIQYHTLFLIAPVVLLVTTGFKKSE